MAPVAITLGDPAGIGPEVVARAVHASTTNSPPSTTPLVIGSAAALQSQFATLGIECEAVPVDGPDHPRLSSDQIPVIDLPGPLPPLGSPSAEGGRHALDALDIGIELALQNRVGALVTAPVSKEAVRLAGEHGFTGHTERLAHRAGDVPVRMMMTCPQLKVVLATTHHALAKVPGLIDVETVHTTLRLTHDALAAHGGIARPRIAVCGLNCHPGEFGEEDERVLQPAIEQARARGIRVDGPFSADALFPQVVHGGSHDAVVAMYHDQGLIPVKLLGFEQAVNITLGLPFVRTSPAHGTAFELAGTGKAKADSMMAALATASRWAGRRP